jgi:transcriptional regulator with XRE-family HTH domain
MSKTRGIDEFVRRRLRELRLSKQIRIKDLAEQAGIPAGSYGCMESGFYNINLDYLFHMLGILEADLHEVWLVESVGSQKLRCFSLMALVRLG